MIGALLNGGLICLHWVFFFYVAKKENNLQLALIGVATTSFWVSLIEPLVFKRKIEVYELVLGLIIIFGFWIMYNELKINSLGLLIATVSGIFAAVFTVINGRFFTRHDGATITFFEMVGSTITAILVYSVYNSDYFEKAIKFPRVPYEDFFYLIILSVLCTAFIYIVFLELMKKISPFTITLNCNLEPIYGLILMFLFFDENKFISNKFYLGTILILAPLFLYSYFGTIKRKKIINSSES